MSTPPTMSVYTQERYEIEHFYNPATDGIYYDNAIKRAQEQWHYSLPATDFDKYKGFTLVFGPREYKFSNSIELIRGMSLVGSGGAGWYAGTVLSFLSATNGIVCRHIDPTHMPDPIPGGDWSIVERCQLRGPNDMVGNVHGVVMNAKMTLRDVFIDGFSGDGIHIEGSRSLGTNANDWQIQNCVVNHCDNGLFVSGDNAGAGCAVELLSGSNRGYGVYDFTQFGNAYVACHTQDNHKGAYYIRAAGAPVCLINCYSEGDQPPSYLGPVTFVIGGLHGAGFTANSQYFGGTSYLGVYPMRTLAVGSIGDLSASAPNLPRVVLGGNIEKESVNIRIEVTMPGILGVARVRWSIAVDAMNNPIWNPSPDPVLPLNPPHQIPLGDSGLTAYFTPGNYNLGNTWAAHGTGGLQAQFTTGSNNGTMSAFGWGHSNAGAEGTDTHIWEMKFIERDWGYKDGLEKRWILQWASSRGSSSMYFSSGRALPYPGAVSFDNLWYGRIKDRLELDPLPPHIVEGRERRITSSIASPSAPPGSVSWTASAGQVGWWRPGDIIFNTDDSNRWPVGWRPTKKGGIGLAFGVWRSGWQASLGCHPGETIEVNGNLYRALNEGTTNATPPTTWPTGLGQTVSDASQMWEWFGIAPSSPDPTSAPPIFEPILDCAPTMQEIDCSLGGGIALDREKIAHARYKLIGAPTSDFSVIIDKGVAGSWDRVVFNATSQEATVKANSSDPGIRVPGVSPATPSGNAYRLLNDGSHIIRVK